MRRLILITALVFTAAASIPACADHVIKGVVIDGSGSAVSGAQITLLRGSRNEFCVPIGRGTAGPDGAFSISYKEPALSSMQTSMYLAGVKGELLGIESIRNPGATQRIALRPRTSISGTVTGSGGPVKGASVKPLYFIRDGFFGQHQIDFKRVEPAVRIRPAVTDMQGRFTLTGLPSGWNVCVRISGSQAAAEYIVAEGAKDVAVTLKEQNAVPSSGRIKGRLLDSSTGKPVPGVKVMAVNAEVAAGVPVSMLTRDDGTFEFNGVTPGMYAVWVMEASKPVQPQMDIQVAENETAEVTLHAVQGTLVQGRVVDSRTGKGVAGVVVASPASKPVSTGRDGAFSIRVLPGPGMLTVVDMTGGYADLNHELEVPEKGGIKGLTLKLLPATRVYGRVTDSSGKTVDGALIRVFYPNMPGDVTQADSLGNYSSTLMYGEPGQGSYFVAALDAVTGSGAVKAFNPQPEKSVQVDLEIGPSATLNGAVKDSSGKPVPNASVLPMLVTGRYRVYSLHNRASTDESGKFTVRSLVADADYALRIDAEGYGQLTVEKDKLPELKAGEISSAEFTLQPKSSQAPSQ